jgi:hypothetical protein
MAEKKQAAKKMSRISSLTTQHLKEALKEQAPAPSVEALTAESMTLNYVKANLTSASVRTAKVSPHENIERKNSKK